MKVIIAIDPAILFLIGYYLVIIDGGFRKQQSIE